MTHRVGKQFLANMEIVISAGSGGPRIHTEMMIAQGINGTEVVCGIGWSLGWHRSRQLTRHCHCAFPPRPFAVDILGLLVHPLLCHPPLLVVQRGDFRDLLRVWEVSGLLRIAPGGAGLVPLLDQGASSVS